MSDTTTPNPTPDAEREALLLLREMADEEGRRATFANWAVRQRRLAREHALRDAIKLTARATHAESALAAALAREAGLREERHGIYVASRASLPARGAMWRSFRSAGWPIISTWIDEDGEGATASFADLWARIEREVTSAAGLIVYAETDDMPLKGALIEAGMALGAGVPVYAVLPGVQLEPRSMRPIGSWLAHPSVRVVDIVETALAALASISVPQPAAKGER